MAGLLRVTLKHRPLLAFMSSAKLKAPRPLTDEEYANLLNRPNCTYLDKQELTPEQQLQFFPKLGGRDIVGSDISAHMTYFDRIFKPFPPVRFRPNTPLHMELKEKSKGDWRNMTIDEIKSCYRHNFCRTIAEIRAIDFSYLPEFTYVLLFLSMVSLMVLFAQKYYFIPKRVSTMSEEWKNAMVQRFVACQAYVPNTLGEKYDYINKEWKK